MKQRLLQDVDVWNSASGKYHAGAGCLFWTRALGSDHREMWNLSAGITSSPHHHQERRLERGERIPGGEKCFPNSPASVSPRLAPGWRPAVRRVGLTPDIYKWHALIDRCHRNNISPHQRYVYHTSRHSNGIGSARQPIDSRVPSSTAALSTKIH